MPFLAVDNIISHIMDYRVDTQQCLLTQHYRITAPTDVGVDMVDLFAALDTHFKTPFGFDDVFANCLSDDAVIVRRYLQAIYPIRYIRLDYTPGEATGSVESTVLPPAVASAITCVPQVAQKGRIGTKHIGGVPTTFVAAGLISEAGQTAYGTLASSMMAPITVMAGPTSCTLQPILFNKTVPANSLDIYTTRVQVTSRTERRRVVGRGT